MNMQRGRYVALAFQPARTAAIVAAQVMVYPLHNAVKNNASEAVLVGLLGTRPNEAKRLDKVRGRWVSNPLILAAARFPSRRLLYSLSVSATCSFARSYVDHMGPTATPALRSVVTCRCTTPR